MTQEIHVKQVGMDDELLYRASDVRIGSTTVINGPARLIDITKVSDFDAVKKLPSPKMFEAYKRPSGDFITKVMNDSAKLRKYNSGWEEIRGNLGDEDRLLVFLDYPEGVYPTNGELRFLIRTIHANSAFSTIPLVSSVSDYIKADKSFDDYAAYLRNALTIIKSFNNKPIMGIIPIQTPFSKVEELMNIYLKEGMGAFAIDFASSKPDSNIQIIEEVLAILNEKGVMDSSYIHALNASPGRPRTTTSVSLCQNILSPGYCLDTFGDLHRTKIRTDYIPPVDRIAPIRLFMRSDYGNHLVNEEKEIEALYPSKSCGISLDRVYECLNNKKVAKFFNSEQHTRELNQVRSILTKSEGVTAHLSAKSQVRPRDIKVMKRLREKVGQKKR